MQAVTISQKDRRLTISCSYIENSTAQGCQITVCLQGMGGEANTSACRTIISRRASPATIIRISDVTTYVITNVSNVEEDGTVREIGNVAVFGALVAVPPTSTIAPLTTAASISRSKCQVTV